MKPGDEVVCRVDRAPGVELTRGRIYVVEAIGNGYLNIVADDSGEPNGSADVHFEPIAVKARGNGMTAMAAHLLGVVS